jgi:hypothetical protein
MPAISCQNKFGKRLGPGASKLQFRRSAPSKTPSRFLEVRPAQMRLSHLPVANSFLLEV